MRVLESGQLCELGTPIPEPRVASGQGEGTVPTSLFVSLPLVTPHRQIKTLGVSDEPPACDPLVSAPQSHRASFHTPGKSLRRQGLCTHRPRPHLAICGTRFRLREFRLPRGRFSKTPGKASSHRGILRAPFYSICHPRYPTFAVRPRPLGQELREKGTAFVQHRQLLPKRVTRQTLI